MRAPTFLTASLFAFALSTACSDPAPTGSVSTFDAALRDATAEADVPSSDTAPVVDATKPDAVTTDATTPDATADGSTADRAATDAPAADAPADVTRDATPTRLRVLFVGNSYTYVNDLPGLVARMGAAASRAGVGPDITTDSVAVGGATLHNHWDMNTAPMRIMAGGWDAVVFQGQSVEPVIAYTDFRTYAVRFGTLATTNHARAVYYATWPRRVGDDVYTQSWSGGTPEVLGMRLHTAYSQVAMLAGGSVAAVGNAWLAALRSGSAIELYASDGSHPSPAGTWLTACVMYRTLVGAPAPMETESAAMGVAPADVHTLRALSAMTP